VPGAGFGRKQCGTGAGWEGLRVRAGGKISQIPAGAANRKYKAGK